MNMDVPPLGPAARATAPARSAATETTPQGFDAVARAAAADTDIPASPPESVMRDVEAAARRAEWMREHGHELRFEIDRSVPTGIRIEVRDLDGRVIRQVPLMEGLAIATGGSVDGVI